MNRTQIAIYGAGLAMAMALVSVSTLYMAKNMFMQAPPKIATINVDALINSVKESNKGRLEAASKRSEIAFNAARQSVMEETVLFAKKFDLAVNTVSEECNCVLMRKDSILSGDVIDLTARVAALIKEGPKPVASETGGASS